MEILYDTAAQAKFINTYVPINFDSMYKAADRDEKDVKDLEQSIEKNQAVWNKVHITSDADKKYWDQKIGEVKNVINDVTSTSDAINSYDSQAKLKNSLRALGSDQKLANVIQSAAKADEYVAKSDPRFGNYEVNKARSHDSSTGVFDLRNSKYEDVSDLIAKDIAEVGKHDTDLGTYGKFDWSGQTKETLKPKIAATAQKLIDDRSADEYINAQLSNGTMDMSKYGTVTEDPITKEKKVAFTADNKRKFIEDQVANEYEKLIHKEKKRIPERINRGGSRGDGSSSSGGGEYSYQAANVKAAQTTINNQKYSHGRSLAADPRYGAVGRAYSDAVSHVTTYSSSLKQANSALQVARSTGNQEDIIKYTKAYNKYSDALKVAQKVVSEKEPEIDRITDVYNATAGGSNNPITLKAKRAYSRTVLDQPAVDEEFTQAHGKPKTMQIFGHPTKKGAVSVYNVTDNTEFTAADEHGMKLTEGGGQLLNTVIHDLQGSFVSPGTTTSTGSNTPLDVTSIMYIPVQSFESKLKQYQNNIDLPKYLKNLHIKKVKLNETADTEEMVYDEGAGKEKKIVTKTPIEMYAINVSKGIGIQQVSSTKVRGLKVDQKMNP